MAANDAVASERSIFSKNHDYNIEKSFPCCGEHVRRGLDARGGKKLRTGTHTHTHTQSKAKCFAAA